MFHPTMQHVGQINQVGGAYVFGLAQQVVSDERTDTVYLNMAGPVTSVEAVWAKLVERGTVICRGSDGKGRYLRHGEQGDSESPYLRFQRRIPGLQIEHLILLDKRFTEAEYVDVGATFLFDTPDMQRKLAEHVRQLVNLPVFAEWAEPLAEIGRVTRLLRPLSCMGEQTVYLLDLDRTRWEQQIALRVEQGELPWPGDAAPAKPISAPEPQADTLPECSTCGKRVAGRRTAQGYFCADCLPVANGINGKPTFTVTHERDWTWVRFEEKPTEAICDALKRAGFRWGKRRRAWYLQRIVEGDQIKTIFEAN